MIIFYNLKSGKIEGTIEGRIHDESHLKMWIGDKKEVGRIVCNWKPTGEKTDTITEEPIYGDALDKDGFTVTVQTGVKKRKVTNIEYEPDTQKDVFSEIEIKGNIKDFKVDVKTKQLVRN